MMCMEKTADLKAFSQNDVSGCFMAQKAHVEQYVTSEGNHFDGDNMET